MTRSEDRRRAIEVDWTDYAASKYRFRRVTDSQAQGDVSVGAWDREGEGFRAVFESFTFDPSGTFNGTAIIRQKGTVDGDSTHGTFTVDFRPASGPTQHGIDHGTFIGNRLEP